MRLIGSLGASLVRLFRKSDTSVPPKIDVTRISREDFIRLVYGGIWDNPIYKRPEIAPLSPGLLAKLEQMPGWDDQHQAGSEPAPSQPGDNLPAGIKPPSDETDGQSWAWWLAQRGDLIPGWAFCRFANRGGDEVAFVFGYVRGSFGVWQRHCDICGAGGVTRNDLLTHVTHLASGNGVGVFQERTVAIQAAELADRVAAEWATATHHDQLGAAILRTREAWEGVGITPCTNYHLHDDDGDVMPIMGRSLESITHGKPERLS